MSENFIKNDAQEDLEYKLGDFKETQKFIGEFIGIYQMHPCLWKYSCKDYRNRRVKDEAYGKLVGKMREIDPRADKNSVLRKINALRTAFRREYKKVRRTKACLKLSIGENNQAKKNAPSLWYFDLLKFVVEQQDEADAESDFDDGDEPEDIVPEHYAEVLEDDKIMDHSDETCMEFLDDTSMSNTPMIKVEPLSPLNCSPPPSINTSTGPTLNLEINSVYSEKSSIPTINNTSREETANIQEPPAPAASFFRQASQVPLTPLVHLTTLPRPIKRPQSVLIQEADHADLDRFGAYVATKLKRSSRKQSIIAEKVIAEVLMRANLGTLEETTVLTDVRLPSTRL